MLLLKKIIIKRNTQKHLKNKGLRYTLFCYIFLKKNNINKLLTINFA